MKEYKLVKKNGIGCDWFTTKENLQSEKNGLVKAYDRTGFETVVRIENYNICRY